MDRALLCCMLLAASSLVAAEPQLPDAVPPFALGDFCVASIVEIDGSPAIKIEMFGLRSRAVEISDDIPVEVDGKLMHPDPFVRDTFSPTRHHSISSSPIDNIAVWDMGGTKLSLDIATKRLARKARAVILSRDVTDGDLAFLQYFGDEVLFIRLSKLTEGILKQHGR